MHTIYQFNTHIEIHIEHSKNTNWYFMHSRTLGQCLNATNSSGKNAYRTFLNSWSIYKYRFNLSYVYNPRSTLIITLKNVCIQSDVIVACEKMHMVLFFVRYAFYRHSSPNPARVRDTGGIRWLVPVKTHTARKTIPYAYILALHDYVAMLSTVLIWRHIALCGLSGPSRRSICEWQPP